MKKHTQQVVALAGIAQAAFLVDQLAKHGLAAHDKLNTCLQSLFVTSPQTTLEVYGSLDRIRLGLQILEEIFISKENTLRTPEVMRYLIGMIYLQTRLVREESMLRTLAGGLTDTGKTGKQSSMQIADNPDVVAQIARLYQQTISTLSFRIQVSGNPQYLKNNTIADTVRATLLAGIRSAVLWHQLGGRRWHFLIFRRRICQDILLLKHKAQQ